MFKKLVFVIILVLCMQALAACNVSPSEPSRCTAVFVPVVVTVELPKPVTVTPALTLTPSPKPQVTRLPTQTPTLLLTQTQKLEEDVQAWNVYREGSPTWVITNVMTPSIDGKSLKCSITGGSSYSNVHCYRNLPSEPSTNMFRLGLTFQFTPTTTCNNRGADSVVQAIEFTMNKWYQFKRYEFAIQWQNVGPGAPQWRYWDPSQPEPNKWLPINSEVANCLEGGRWHTFSLEGRIVDGQVYYQNFVIDKITYNLDLIVPPASVPGEDDRLAVAVQIDGNKAASPYDIFIDQVTFFRQSSAPIVDCRSVKTAQITEPPYGSVVRGESHVSWTPACVMDLQYYQGNKLIFRHYADSGEFDLSMIPPGRTEIKIWIPEAQMPADAIEVIVRD